MKGNTRFLDLIDKLRSGYRMNAEECAFLLEFKENSLEASVTRAVADAMARAKFDNKGLVFGQIGFEIAPCPGDCQFCSFAEDYTGFQPFNMSDEAILEAARGFAADGKLFSLSLMAMHHYDFNRVLDVVRLVRQHIPAKTNIIVNIGDFNATQASELKAAGADGAYHVIRLREGKDTKLDPKNRERTLEAIKGAGLDLYYCCEPVGPEHTPAEMAAQIMHGIQFGCFQNGAMRRVCLPSSPLSKYGYISDLRLAQIVAVVTLASLPLPELKTIGVHEPNLLGLTAGANAIYAETGANPRDTERETSGHRGLDIADCETMLWECGFELTY